MEISYFGNSAFAIKSKDSTVVTDPYADGVKKWPKQTANIVTVSTQDKDHNNTGGISGEPVILSSPGEYEASGITIYGIADSENTIYTLRIEGITIAHLGTLDHELNDKMLEEIGEVDILLVPVSAVKAVGAIEPKVVIPMAYSKPDSFLKDLGIAEPRKETKLKITKSQLPMEDMEIILLTPS